MIRIYILRKDADVFYVGATQDPKGRLVEHRRKHGDDITLTVVEVCSGRAAYEREYYWIGRMIAEGHNLVNVKRKSFRELPKQYVTGEKQLKLVLGRRK